eukprot:scaffold71173_cov30-Tisochrysis_lutea.AAC.1
MSCKTKQSATQCEPAGRRGRSAAPANSLSVGKTSQDHIGSYWRRGYGSGKPPATGTRLPVVENTPGHVHSRDLQRTRVPESQAQCREER